MDHVHVLSQRTGQLLFAEILATYQGRFVPIELIRKGKEIHILTYQKKRDFLQLEFVILYRVQANC